jgi:hypothetical protein
VEHARRRSPAGLQGASRAGDYLQVLPWQVGVKPEHTCPHWPQFELLMEVSISQPSPTKLLQSLNGKLQEAMVQFAPAQPAIPLGTKH